EHRAKTSLESRARGRGGPQEALGAADVVAEVDETRPGKQLLIALKCSSELELPAGFLSQGIGRRPVRIGRVPTVGPNSVGCAARLRGKSLRVGQVVGRAHVLVLAPRKEGRQGSQESSRVAEWAVLIELEVEEVLAQEDDDFGPGQHADVDRQPELERELADDS